MIKEIFHSLLKIIVVVPNTLFLAFIIQLIGLIIGGLIAVINIRKARYSRLPISIFLSYMRGVPLVVHLFIAQAALPKIILALLSIVGSSITKITIPSVVIVIVCYCLFEGAVESEIIRGIILSFNYEQYEAGVSIGLSPLQVIRRIAIPQILVTAIPQFLNALLRIVRILSVAFLVGVIEIMAVARYTAALTSSYVAAYIAAGLVYWIICLIAQMVLKKIETKLKFD